MKTKNDLKKIRLISTGETKQLYPAMDILKTQTYLYCLWKRGDTWPQPNDKARLGESQKRPKGITVFVYVILSAGFSIWWPVPLRPC